ncbi:low molecular weight phosphatase family protein [Nitrosopumilus sp. b1]|uniref:arsenate reductase ArsC n=1 Tax=Nitrosopumilus sp. b1 TaxID=2109907 RepID=UPI0015F77D88|nr:arsenate reductase ArsC [Nitrosopumilus sp. b1]KAF6242474.1 low molecular weight phosphatase family protein [Nitrosopumilus sp. b1]
MPENNKILFVCVENAGRSQMAEAFFKKYATGKFQATSAGTIPADKVNPIVVQAMKEVGIDLSAESPKTLTESVIHESFRTINMGCMDKKSCPALFAKDILDWGIEDPKGKSIEEVRIIRDDIESKIKKFIQNLEAS